jgi:hypothetical protein
MEIQLSRMSQSQVPEAKRMEKGESRGRLQRAQVQSPKGGERTDSDLEALEESCNIDSNQALNKSSD